MSHTAQCDGKSGVCPDERIGGRNDVTLISGDRKNGVTTVTYSKPLQTNEAVNDRPIPSQGEVSVIAAFGPLNSRKEANAHSIRDKTVDDDKIDFSDFDDNRCTGNLYELVDEDGPKPWPPAKIIGKVAAVGLLITETQTILRKNISRYVAATLLDNPVFLPSFTSLTLTR
jgi:hypothetical protein